jgi:hypothetical protein
MKLVILLDIFLTSSKVMRVGLILVPSLDVSGYEDCILDVKVLELRVKK